MRSESQTHPGVILNALCLVHAAITEVAKNLSVGQIRIYDNLLLKRPLTLVDVEHMLRDRWGTTPGLRFVCAFNQIVVKSIGPTVNGRNRRL